MKTIKTEITMEEATTPGLRNVPFQMMVEDGLMIMVCGVETLAYCTKKVNGGPLKGDVSDPDGWAKDVVRELGREEENGDTPFYKLLDHCMRNAANNGSAHLEP